MNNKDEFEFDFADMSSIDDQLLAEMDKPGLIDRMEEDSEKREAEKQDWTNDVKRDPAIYVFLCISAVFTALLGIMLGLAPEKMLNPDGSSYIHFHDDWVHILITILLVIGFVGVTEYAYVIGKKKNQDREDANPEQNWASSTIMTVALISVLITGITGGIVTANVLGFLSEFEKIPPGAQIWAAIAIPLLIAVYTHLTTKYRLASRIDKSLRMTRDQDQRMDLENTTRMNRIRRMAMSKAQYAYIRRFWQAVNEGLMTPDEAQTAIDAKETIFQTEKRLGRDLTGDKKIGEQHMLTPQAPGPALPNVPVSHKQYTAEEWLKFAGMRREEAFNMFQGIDFQSAGGAWNRLFMDYGMIPPGMTFTNFKEIYHNIIIEDFPGKERFQGYGPAGDPARVPASRNGKTPENF